MTVVCYISLKNVKSYLNGGLTLDVVSPTNIVYYYNISDVSVELSKNSSVSDCCLSLVIPITYLIQL